MNKWSGFCALLIGSLLLSSPAWATKLTVTGRSEIKVAPDQAVISLQVMAEKMTAAAAKTAVDQKVTQIRKGLTRWFSSEQMVNEQLRVSPRYRYERDTQERSLEGYQARRRIRLTLTQLDELSNILDQALKDGADEVAQISYQNSHWQKLSEQVRLQAVANGQQLAKQFAAAVNKKVAAIISMDYQGQRNEVAPVMLRTMQVKVADSANYQTQQLTIDDSVLMTFDLQ